MDLFLGMWPRTYVGPTPFSIEADEVVTAAAQEMLRLSGPMVPMPQPWGTEFMGGVIATVDHMQTYHPIDYTQKLPEFTHEMSMPDMQLYNLRCRAYHLARQATTRLLAEWCKQAGSTRHKARTRDHSGAWFARRAPVPDLNRTERGIPLSDCCSRAVQRATSVAPR